MRRLTRAQKWALRIGVATPLIFLVVYFLLFQKLPFMPSPDLTDTILSQSGPAAGQAAHDPGATGTGDRVQYGVLASEKKPGPAAAGTTAAVLLPAADTSASATRRPGAVGTSTASAAVSTGTPLATTRGVIQHGMVQAGTINSTILGERRPFLIYLPPGYNAGTRRYPVVYLLHGAPGNYKDWQSAAGIDKTLDALISVGRIPPLIAVLPDGNGGFFGGDTEWANSGSGKRAIRVEDYLTQEVVPYIDTHYRTRADRSHRAIGGLSTGGFGATNVTLHHPDMFGYAFGLSGNYLAVRTWTGKDLWSGDKAAKAYNSPTLYAPKVSNIRQLHFCLIVGASDNLDNTLHETHQFDAVLTKLHVPHVAYYAPGLHSWRFWRLHVVDALEYMAQVMPA